MWPPTPCFGSIRRYPSIIEIRTGLFSSRYAFDAGGNGIGGDQRVNDTLGKVVCLVLEDKSVVFRGDKLERHCLAIVLVDNRRNIKYAFGTANQFQSFQQDGVISGYPVAEPA